MAAHQSRKERSSNYIMTFRVMLITTLVVTVKGDCGPPTVSQSAELSRKYNDEVKFAVGSTVIYICRPGYVKIPGKLAYRICQPGSQWSQMPEFCQPRTCGNPGEIKNGWVEVSGVSTYTAKATFGCDKGYRLLSSRPFRQCMETGLWSNEVPVCEPIVCLAPPDIPNGIHSGTNSDEFTFLTGVTYKCTAGALIGEASIYCTEHGNWSAPAPACIDASCPWPRVRNGRMEAGFGSSFTVGDVVRFQCEEGFTLNGSSVLRCNEDGVWNPPMPVCVQKTSCPKPNIANGYETDILGRQVATRTVYGKWSPAYFTCKDGYIINDNKVVWCGTNFQWTSSLPVCIPTCPEPKVTHGKITRRSGGERSVKAPYKITDEVTFQCDAGYVMNGESVIRCEADSKWSPPLPTCEPVTCPEPKVVHGKITHSIGGQTAAQTVYRFLELVTFQCEDGYAMFGESVIRCEADSKWSPPLPSCEPVTCPEPKVVHGKITPRIGGQTAAQTVYRFLELVTFQCEDGYAMYGESEIRCEADSKWSPPLPSCEPESSPLQPVYVPRVHGEALTNTGPEAEQITIATECPARFLPLGTPNLTCVEADTLDLPEDAVIPGHAEALCGFVGKSRKENWVIMNLDEKNTLLEMENLCLDIRDLHLQMEKINVRNTPCQPKKKRGSVPEL